MKRKMKRKRITTSADVNEGDNVDLISGLPDDILVYLLSFLEMKTAARTSLLSKRWSYIWTYLVHLDFDDPGFHLIEGNPTCDQIDKYHQWVHKVITTNRASWLSTFRIHFPLNSLNVADINKWVRFALSKDVRNLELNLSPWGLTTEVDGYILRWRFLFYQPVYTYKHLTYLKSLHLEALSVVGNVIEHVLFNCLNLDRLMLRDCRFYSIGVFLETKLVVSSLSLKHFELSHFFGVLESLQISAPKLSSFIFMGWGKAVVEYIHVPALVNVTFGYAYRL
ncbi:putative F-box/LRR-repeat protein At4g15060 isoform X1 [Spinacia oleracea]|uniref:F-box/LRR-repeat protein At4g15060 isoform X1 n=1 Tax=Spinacia oleracea TaxID=3562 RepID=A0ABM3R0I9_SPIOL|nr:putative F-box/LRR-repeat protein At4g15060 isoform X1 [Spinacia oleracea]XP_056689121.1 putative F-box/LRR-repeat protein At4g15060 isoform X1 [Spinacia oleracea]